MALIDLRWPALAALLSTAAAPGLAAATADLMLVNAKVVTVDRQFSIKSAAAIKDGRIVAVGGAELARRYRGVRQIDLGGRTLMPGFIDTHLHLMGLARRAVEPGKAGSIADIQAMVAAKAKALGKGEWISGYGWDEALLSDRRVPTRADLDAAAPDNPVVLTRAGAHSAVANSAALRLANIDAAAPEPEGGMIERGPDRQPTGIIRERTDLVMRLVPVDTAAQMRPSYIASLKSLLTLGITSFMEAHSSIDDEPVGKGGKAEPSARHSWKQFSSIYDEMGAELPRVALYISYPGAERLKAFPYHTGHGDDRLKLGPIGENPFDGGFTGPTALTKENYKGLPGFRGRAFYSPAAATELVKTSAALGWQLGIHAIGDAAIETMTGVYDAELRARPRQDHRWFLSHLTMIPSVATMKTLAADKIYAAAQPNFLYNLEARYEATLDGYRLQHINPVALPLRYGVNVVFGSDNLPIGPMTGIYAAVSRKGSDGRVFGADEAVSRQQAIRLYTQAAAYLSWDEKKKGSIEPGKFADLIVLDRDVLTIPEAEILQIKVDMTIVGGRILYTRSGT